MSEPHGRIRVQHRALTKVARQVCAAAMDVPRDEVHVEVSDAAGDLSVRVASRLRVCDLGDAEAVHQQGPLLPSLRRRQTEIAQALAHITGRTVRRVTVTVTGAIGPERRRVS